VLELLSMKSSSTVQGDLYYGQLSVEAGAKALGTFRMGISEDKASLVKVKEHVKGHVKGQAQKTASKADALASLKASTMPSESSSLLNDEVTVGAE
jgi:hypothetical protein